MRTTELLEAHLSAGAGEREAPIDGSPCRAPSGVVTVRQLRELAEPSLDGVGSCGSWSEAGSTTRFPTSRRYG